MAEKRMLISQHLTELRSRLVICIVTTVLMAVLAYVYCPDVFYPIIRGPLDSVAGNPADNPHVFRVPGLSTLIERYREGAPQAHKEALEAASRLHNASLVDPLIVRLKVSLVVGIILALPIIAYEVWAFVSAGLYPSERKYVLTYGPASFLLFLVGVAVAYFVVLPLGVIFLLEQGVALDLRPMLMLKNYVPFVLWPMLGFGLVFQMPLVVLFLTKLGIVGPRALARSRRYAILVIFIVAAFLTPPDPFTQLAMALPMLALYEISILLSRLAVRKRRTRPEQPSSFSGE